MQHTILETNAPQCQVDYAWPICKMAQTWKKSNLHEMSWTTISQPFFQGKIQIGEGKITLKMNHKVD
jgi:hypothetical protein